MNKLNEFQKKILFWLIFGLLIRFLLMPFLAHNDFFLVYGRVVKALTGEANFLAYGQPLFHIFHFFGFLIARPFISLKDLLSVFVDQNLANPHVLSVIFLGKLPFVVFEYLSLYLLLQFLNKKDWLKVVVFWLFNPVNLYVLYAFGRFESVVTFLLLWFFWLLKKQKNTLAYLVFGLLTLTRTFFLVFLPLYFLLIDKKVKEKIKFGVFGVIPFSLWYFSNQFFLKITPLSNLIQEGKHGSYFFSSQISLGQGQAIYLFFFVYVLICLFAWIKKEKLALNEFFLYSFAVMVSYYSLGFFHPQYFAWVIPFLALLVVSPNYTKLVWLWSFLFLPMLLFWDNFTTLGLLTPVAGFFNDFSPVGWLDKFFPATKFLNLCRTFFSATGLYLLWLVFKEKSNVFKND